VYRQRGTRLYPFDALVVCGLDALRALLDEHGMSAADLARLLGVHRSMGWKLLKGERALTARYLQNTQRAVQSQRGSLSGSP
jgi:antitoxin component HigA of HigAB toxin-antitoxin module